MIRILALLFVSVAAWSQDFALTSRVNPRNVYAGSPLTIEVDVAFATPPYNHVTPTLTTSAPDITVVPWCGVYAPACWGSPAYIYNSAATVRFWVVVTPSSSAAAGPRTVTVTATSNAILHTLVLPVNVLPAPAAIAGPVQPPLPADALKAFGAAMLVTTSPNTSTARCDPANPAKYTWDFGVESEVWYYDGAFVYFSIADYTKDSRWKGCGLNLAAAYRDYVLKGGVPGWRVFSQGLSRAYKETGDKTYLDAIAKLISTGSAYGVTGGDPSDLLIRETSYMLRAYTDAHLLGLPVDQAAVSRSLNWLLGDFQTLFGDPPQSSRALEHQSFMDGLAAEALTYYYDNWNADPRIPPTIKTGLDWIWTHMWDDASGKLEWSPFALNAGYPRHCASSCQVYVTGLIGLVHPFYWWYSRLVNDPAYGVKGDRMFAGLNAGPKPYMGKEFSQWYHLLYLLMRCRL